MLAWRKLVFQLVELVKQSKRRNCEDMNVVAMMYIGKKAGPVVLPHFFHLMGNCQAGLYSVG